MKSPRRGLRFRFEKDMLLATTAALPRVLDVHRKCIKLREPSIRNVIPDLLFCCYERLPPSPSQRPLSTTQALILLQIAGYAEAELADIQNDLFISAGTLDKTVNTLVRQGLIERTESGSFRIANRSLLDDFELIAIETKLRRWREALRQAKGYLAFANRAYVVLDGRQTRVSPQLLQEFRSSPVGLLIQNGRAIELLCPAVSHAPRTVERIIAVQKALASRRGG